MVISVQKQTKISKTLKNLFQEVLICNPVQHTLGLNLDKIMHVTSILIGPCQLSSNIQISNCTLEF